MSRQQPTQEQHETIWATIEAIAKKNNMSLSGLAIAAGMNPTAFNKSKRMSCYKRRMPTTTTIISIMQACNMDWFQWAKIYQDTKKDNK